MAAAQEQYYTYIHIGGAYLPETEYPPDDVTHARAHESIWGIACKAFYEHQNIVEFICHDGITAIIWDAFYACPCLGRVIMRGVRVVDELAFCSCEALSYVECERLETIGGAAFAQCKLLSSINLSSARVVGIGAFDGCIAMTEATFGKNLEAIKTGAFVGCHSLERITLPLKNGTLTADNIFAGCKNLRHVDLVEREVLQETINVLLLEEWRRDMKFTMDSIIDILPITYAGYAAFHDEDGYYEEDEGQKARMLRGWINRVLSKIIHYKAAHRRLLNEAATALKLSLPSDTVMNDVVPFLELPLHTFDGEE